MNPNLKSPITPQQEANLRHLAKRLMKFKPNEKSEFDMSRFSETGNDYSTKCGSVGCAVGHGPYFGIKKYSNENWTRYSDRVFGLKDNESKWCFSGAWSIIDNTPQGASKRITWLLDKGLPNNWDRQMDRIKPLCYQ